MDMNYQRNIENILSISKQKVSDDVYLEFSNELYSLVKENSNAVVIAKKLASILGNFFGSEIEEEWHSKIFQEYTILLKKIYK